MKAIMISIQPQWVEKILNGEKTIEIRKTMPKCDLPCKVYIYCTKGKSFKDTIVVNHSLPTIMPFYANGRVVAEFTLNKVDTIEVCDPDILLNGKQKSWNWFKNKSCLDDEQIMYYIGYGNDHDGWGRDWDKGYAWHIDDLKIYDKPKELSEFTHLVPDYSNGVVMFSLKPEPLKRPPQSWCYVDALNEKTKIGENL